MRYKVVWKSHGYVESVVNAGSVGEAFHLASVSDISEEQIDELEWEIVDILEWEDGEL